MADGKPKVEELLDLCNDTISDHSARDTLFTDLEEYYFLDQAKKDKAAEEEGIEVVRLPYATSAIELVQDLLAEAGLTISVPAQGEGPKAKELADACEKYLLAVMDQSERVQKMGLLAQAAWVVAMRGCIAGRVMAIQKWLNETDAGTWEAGQRVPLLLQLRDPLYVFPAFGLDGLAYVVEKRTRTVRDLRNSLGEDLLPKAKLTDEVEWIEYWDDTWFCYWADGEPVKLGAGAGPWPHRYGGIPYAFQFARQTARKEPDKRVRPLIESVRTVIDRLALLDSAEATFIMDYNGDALMVYTGGDREIDKRSGAVNYMEPEDKVEWLRSSRQPLEMQAAHGKYNAQLQKATFPDAVFGLDPGRVMSGFALNMLNQSGQIRLRPMLKCVECFLGELLENALMISENYLTDLLGGAIPFYLTADKEDQEGSRFRSRQEQKLDAKKLGGWYQVEATLGDVMPADQQANLALATQAHAPGPDGRPLLSWETVVDKYGLAESPETERDRIDREMALSDPQVVALTRALYAAQIKQDLMDELTKLDIDPAEVLAMAAGPAQAEAMPPEAMPPEMMGGEEIPPEMLAMLAQGMMEPGPEEMAPPAYPRPRRPNMM